METRLFLSEPARKAGANPVEAGAEAARGRGVGVRGERKARARGGGDGGKKSWELCAPGSAGT